MAGLSEIQRRFIQDCLSGPLSEENIRLAKQLDCSHTSAKGLMNIYRESALGNITAALQLTYPVIERLLGEEFFTALSRKFIEQHWPKSGNMDDYGGEFADFIQSFEHTRHLLYLPDVARLEWLFHLSSLADESSDFDWQELAELSFEQIAKLDFTPAPSLNLLSSPYPVDRIWRMNQEDGEQDDELDLSEEKGVFLLLLRAGLKVNIQRICQAEYSFLSALAQGYTLVESLNLIASRLEPNKLVSMVQKHLQLGSFIPSL